MIGYFIRPFDFLWWHFLSLDSTWTSAKTSFLRKKPITVRTRRKKPTMHSNTFVVCHCGCVTSEEQPVDRACLKNKSDNSEWRTALWLDNPVFSLLLENVALQHSGVSWIHFLAERPRGEGFMGIWTNAFLCALCRLTWLPSACTTRVIWILAHRVSTSVVTQGPGGEREREGERG